MAISETRAKPIRIGRRLDWLLTIAFFLTALGFVFMIRELPFRAVIFPCFIAALIVINVIIYSLHKIKTPAIWDISYDPEVKEDADVGPDFVIARSSNIRSAFIAFFTLSMMTFLLGQVYAIPLFVTGYLLQRKENKILAILSGALLWGIIQFVFAGFMSLNLPTGYLLSLF